jgi:hypothetical protein
MLTWWLRAILFLVLTGIAADMAWRSPWTYNLPKYLRIPLEIVVITLIGIYASSNVLDEYRQENTVPPPRTYIISDGLQATPNESYAVIPGNPPTVRGVAGSQVTIDGTLLKQFANKYRMVAVAFHYNGTGDYSDVTDICKSGLFDIGPRRIEIRISWNKKFLREMLTGAKQTNYIVLLLPNGLDVDQFNSIRQALRLGGMLVQGAGGPP